MLESIVENNDIKFRMALLKLCDALAPVFAHSNRYIPLKSAEHLQRFVAHFKSTGIFGCFYVPSCLTTIAAGKRSHTEPFFHEMLNEPLRVRSFSCAADR